MDTATVATAMASALPNDQPTTQEAQSEAFPRLDIKSESDSESDSYDDTDQTSTSDSDSNSEIVPSYDEKKNKVVLSCTFCSAQSSNHSRMVQHIKEHAVERPWSCMKCHFQAVGREFSMLRHSPHCLDYVELVRSCDDCHLERLDSAFNVSDHRCTICDFSSPSLRKVLTHIEQHIVRSRHEATSDSEDEIADLVTRGTPLRPSSSKYLPAKRSYCQKCGFDCACAKDGERPPIKCADCYVECGGFHEYVVHVRKSHPDEKFKCYLCTRRYLRAENLSNHLRTHEGNLQCMFCDYYAPNLIRFRIHVRTHAHLRTNGVKRRSPPQPVADTYFYCPQCHVRSSNYNYVVAHCLRHVVKEPYECKKCHRRFVKAGELSDHYVGHIDENSIVCESCDKTFTNVDALRVHRITVHGEKRAFSCHSCAYKFERLTDLESHQLTHQEKPFMCDLCGREFNHLSNLKSHKSANHGSD